MRITWLGHSCFSLEQDGYRIVIDPYEKVEGYPPLHTEANAVYCSHEHFDHNYRAAVQLLSGGKNPFTVETVATYHDEKQGALRGENTIHVFKAGGVTVVHLGDVGHPLSEEQLAPLQNCDVLLVPVGGTYTVDADGAKQITDEVAPRVVVPMHYRNGALGFGDIGTAVPFLAKYEEQEILRLSENSFTLTNDLPAVVVPTFSS